MIGDRISVGGGERVAVWVTVVAGVVLAGLGVSIELAYGSGHWTQHTATVVANVAVLSFVITGAIIVLKAGERIVGWSLLGIGISFSVDSTAAGWASAYVNGRVEIFGRWACWIDEWIWIFLLFGVWLLLAIFPDGAPFGRSGRLYLGAAIAVAAVLLTTRPFHGGQLDDYPSVTTPVPRIPLLREWADLVGYAWLAPVLVAIFLLGFASLVHRYVRSDGMRRAQLRWVAWQFGVTLTILLLQQIPLLRPALEVVSLVLIPLLPVAIGLSMARDRLYDIDRLISRTVSYGLLTGTLAAAYAGIVTLASAVVPDRLGSLGVALATLVVAAVFVPGRRLLQQIVDRRFDRARVSYRRIAEEFGRSTRRDTNPTLIETDLLSAVEQTLTPAHASVWVLKPIDR